MNKTKTATLVSKSRRNTTKKEKIVTGKAAKQVKKVEKKVKKVPTTVTFAKSETRTSAAERIKELGLKPTPALEKVTRKAMEEKRNFYAVRYAEDVKVKDKNAAHEALDTAVENILPVARKISKKVEVMSVELAKDIARAFGWFDKVQTAK